MTNPAIWNIDPALTLLGVGLFIALIPLAWWWKAHRRASPLLRLRALTYLILFLTFDLVIFGAFTRLTDSGLGCPDWPGCYGSASPMGAQHHIHAAQTAMPDGPVTIHKAWIEMIHRYLASAVGALIIVLTTLSWRWRRALHTISDAYAVPSPWWATATLVWVCVQGAFGALTVTLKLYPAVVTLHLLGGIGLLVLLSLQLQRYTWASGMAADNRSAPAQPALPLAATPIWLKALVIATLLFTLLQIMLGAWVSTNYAVLICTDFPTCHGQWWPTMDFAQGFTLFRHLGLDSTGELLAIEALTAIHYTHRLMAYFVLLLLSLLGAIVWRFAQSQTTPIQQASTRSYAWGLWALALGQFATGLSNIILGWPLLAALMHTAGAALLMVLLCLLLAHLNRLKPNTAPLK
jgi:cytochrome c oxidase assembly protein subunit 15